VRPPPGCGGRRTAPQSPRAKAPRNPVAVCQRGRYMLSDPTLGGKTGLWSDVDLVELLEGSSELIFDFITSCEQDLSPAASMGHNIHDEKTRLEYAKKLDRNAVVLASQSSAHELNGMIAFYCNDTNSRKAHISYLAVADACRGSRLAERLVITCFSHCKLSGMRSVTAETWKGNMRLIRYGEILFARWVKSRKQAFRRPRNRESGGTIQLEIFLDDN
jgi:ribosomal protein S18 acetylase RimI-like enzyme